MRRIRQPVNTESTTWNGFPCGAAVYLRRRNFDVDEDVRRPHESEGQPAPFLNDPERVVNTSSYFPQLNRNPNAGEPFGKTVNVRIANRTRHYPGAHFSRTAFPVSP